MRDSHEEGIAGEQYNISRIRDIPRRFLLGMHMAVLLIDSGLARFKFPIERASQRVQFIAVSAEQIRRVALSEGFGVDKG